MINTKILMKSILNKCKKTFSMKIEGPHLGIIIQRIKLIITYFIQIKAIVLNWLKNKVLKFVRVKLWAGIIKNRTHLNNLSSIFYKLNNRFRITTSNIISISSQCSNKIPKIIIEIKIKDKTNRIKDTLKTKKL